MPNQDEFPAVFAQLKKILRPYGRRLTVTADTPSNYSLDAGYSEQYQHTLFFCAVQIKKNYVSFHLMPVYMFPDLLTDLSPALKKRMQGKSCFNFKTVDKALFAELAALTKKSVARAKHTDWV
jgi:hypothetical protein